MLALTEGHKVTLTTGTRQLGRQSVTDHKWSCECGQYGTPRNGFSTQREAYVDSLAHRQR